MPWRGVYDPYLVLVSEVMLQQTRVNTVLGYFDSFVERFQTLQALAEAPTEAILKQWEGMGYYSRARYLQQACQQLVREHEGTVPGDYDELLRLPGVGPYTAAAVASIAFGQPRAAVDANVSRVGARLFVMDEPVGSQTARHRLMTVLNDVIPRDAPGEFNQAMMELGATVCTPSSPGCDRCPLARFCGALATGRVGELPYRSGKVQRPARHFVALAVSDGERWLVQRRAEDGLLAGMWEYPMVGLEKPFEDSPMAAMRAVETVEQRFGLAVHLVGGPAHFRHEFSHKIWKVSLFAGVIECEEDGVDEVWMAEAGEPYAVAIGEKSWRFASDEELGRLPQGALQLRLATKARELTGEDHVIEQRG